MVEFRTKTEKKARETNNDNSGLQNKQTNKQTNKQNDQVNSPHKQKKKKEAKRERNKLGQLELAKVVSNNQAKRQTVNSPLPQKVEAER